MLVPPVAQHRTRYIFLIPSGYGDNVLLMSVPSGTDVMLDGGAPSGCERDAVGALGGVDYDALRCPVEAGEHAVEAPQPFGLVVEGWGPGPVSYGYTGGMDLEPVNTECSRDDDCASGNCCYGGACEVCFG